MDANSLDVGYTTIEQNFVEYPIRSLKFLLKKLRIRKLFNSHIRDPRSRVDNYDLTSLLMHGLITHLFRSPSKNKFHLHLLRSNASRAVARFNRQSVLQKFNPKRLIGSGSFTKNSIMKISLGVQLNHVYVCGRRTYSTTCNVEALLFAMTLIEHQTPNQSEYISYLLRMRSALF